jgi:hypothetical protein
LNAYRKKYPNDNKYKKTNVDQHVSGDKPVCGLAAGGARFEKRIRHSIASFFKQG